MEYAALGFALVAVTMAAIALARMQWLYNKWESAPAYILRDETVTCLKCKVLLKKDHAFRVQSDDVYSSQSAYYCQEHRPPYDKHSFGQYYKTVRCTSTGELK